MDNIDISNFNHVSRKELSKLVFIYNALEDGWKIKKREGKYIFTKHNSKNKEVYMDDYLKKFLVKNFNFDKFFNDI